MIPRFSLARPRSLDEALAAHAASDGEGAYVAGGTELLQVMKMGLAQFRTLIDLKQVAELRGIDRRVRRHAAHRRRRHPSRDRAEPCRRRVCAGARGAGAAPRQRPRAQPGHARRQSRVRGAALRPGDVPARLRRPDRARRTRRAPAPGDRRVHRRAAVHARGSRRRSWSRSGCPRPPTAKVAATPRRSSSSVPRWRWRCTSGSPDGAVAAATVASGRSPRPRCSSRLPPTGLVGAAADEASVADAARTTAVAAFADVDAVGDLNGAADYKRHLAGVLLERAARAAVREAIAHA